MATAGNHAHERHGCGASAEHEPVSPRPLPNPPSHVTEDTTGPNEGKQGEEKADVDESNGDSNDEQALVRMTRHGSDSISEPEAELQQKVGGVVSSSAPSVAVKSVDLKATDQFVPKASNDLNGFFDEESDDDAEASMSIVAVSPPVARSQPPPQA